MVLPTPLPDGAVVLVADASVVINLDATGYAMEIIAALPHPLVMIDAVADELEEGRHKGRRAADQVRQLASERLLEIKSLGPAGFNYLEGLVVGSARETLDDGEAATIAYALEQNAIPVIDERKAIRICGERFPSLELRSTLDLIAHDAVQRALGEINLADAVFNALQLARMRVLPDRVSWVVSMIGADRASTCASLPRAVRTSR